MCSWWLLLFGGVCRTGLKLPSREGWNQHYLGSNHRMLHLHIHDKPRWSLLWWKVIEGIPEPWRPHVEVSMTPPTGSFSAWMLIFLNPIGFGVNRKCKAREKCWPNTVLVPLGPSGQQHKDDQHLHVLCFLNLSTCGAGVCFFKWAIMLLWKPCAA